MGGSFPAVESGAGEGTGCCARRSRGDGTMAGHPGHGRDRAGMHAPARGPAVAAEPSALHAAVSERVGESRFGLWFGDGVHLGFSGDGSALEVRVPDAFFRDWIRRHYSESLLEAGVAVAGRPLRLSIEVRDEEEPPLGDVVAPAPAHGEPDAKPRRGQTITVPIPGNPKAPLSLPTPAPGGPDPDPSSLPSRSDRPGPRHRMTAPPATTSLATGSKPARPSRRLDDFMTGPGNRLAHAAAREMAQSAGTDFNPLVIHGGIGMGKSHLLEATGHALRRSATRA